MSVKRVPRQGVFTNINLNCLCRPAAIGYGCACDPLMADLFSDLNPVEPLRLRYEFPWLARSPNQCSRLLT